MSRFVASFPSLAQPRVAAVALIGLALAGCSNSSRFDTPYASNTRATAPQQQRPEYTGSIAQRPAPVPTSRIVSQPLPQPSAPQTVQASNNYPAGGQGAYRPSAQPQYQNDVTGSVAAKSTGGWTWDGGTPVTVGQGESIETIARVNRVPVQALMQTNGITNAAQIRPGQRLVIPRYVASGAPQVAAAPQMSAPQMAAPAASTAGNVHVVGPGESLMSISRRNAIPLSTLARANNIQPSAQLKIGDRITIPGGRQTAAAPQRLAAPAAPAMTMAAPAMAMAQPAPQIAAPQVAQPRTIPMDKTAAVTPTQTARMATQEPATTETAASGPEAAGAVPSFRWPVHGRVIAAFGSKPNGVQNDGINLAVPEGTPVKAAEDGVVAYAGNELKGYGNLVLIRHANGFVSAYANARDLLVKRGDNIKRGQVIANAGQTGNVTSPQLHFEIRKGSTPVDPTKYLSGT